ncbi:MAG TPA: hypothetical protein VLV84_03315 [Candidatus Acidoferrales bacterium]|nr:hypothetical protein [Candidatus Acidoferrales bacterium]
MKNKTENPLKSKTVWYKKLLPISALVFLMGLLLSGPVGTVLSVVVKPQPAWVDMATFISYYSPVQVLPWAFGFILATGFILFAASCYFEADQKRRPLVLAALIFTAVFASIVFIEYTIQVAYIPDAFDQNQTLLAALNMANPKSVCWAFEMFAYAAMGVATMLIAPIFGGRKIRVAIKYFFVLNGLISVAGAVLTSITLSWVFTMPGLVSYVFWNLLVATAMILVIIDAAKNPF